MDSLDGSAGVAGVLSAATAGSRALAFEGPGEADLLAIVLRDVIFMTSDHSTDGVVPRLTEASHETTIRVGIKSRRSARSLAGRRP